MSRKLWAVVSAAVTLLTFTVLPLYAPRLLPPELESVLSMSGLNLTNFTNQISIIGVITTVLVLMKGFVEASSPIYLLTSIASSLVTLALTTITLSLGDWRNMGVNTVTVEVQQVSNTVVIDLRLFIYLTALTVALQIIRAILEFAEARERRTPPLTEIEHSVSLESPGWESDAPKPMSSA